MSDTPRTDSEANEQYSMGLAASRLRHALVQSEFARQLERELNEANERVKRLEEALDTLTLVVGLTPIAGNKDALQAAMDIARSELKAKKAKP